MHEMIRNLNYINIEKKNSKSKVTKKNCDSNLNRGKINLKQITTKKNIVNFEIRIERNYKFKNYDEKRQNATKMIIEGLIQAIIMKIDHMIARKIAM